MRTVEEIVREIRTDRVPVSGWSMCQLVSALMSELPDPMRFGTWTTGPCSVPFASRPEAVMVQDLIRSRPDVAEDVSALHCRGLCGDESVVAACRRLAFREGAASRGVSTMALCSLGTTEAVDALREILRADACRKLHTDAGYALVWHHDDSGADAIQESLAGRSAVDRIVGDVFLAACGLSESCDRLLVLLEGRLSSEVRGRLLGGLAGALVLRRRTALEPEGLREWLEERRVSGRGERAKAQAMRH